MKCPVCSYEPQSKPKVFCPSCGAVLPTFKPSKATAAPKFTAKAEVKKAEPKKRTSKKSAARKK